LTSNTASDPISCCLGEAPPWGDLRRIKRASGSEINAGRCVHKQYSPPLAAPTAALDIGGRGLGTERAGQEGDPPDDCGDPPFPRGLPDRRGRDLLSRAGLRLPAEACVHGRHVAPAHRDPALCTLTPGTDRILHLGVSRARFGSDSLASAPGRPRRGLDPVRHYV